MLLLVLEFMSWSRKLVMRSRVFWGARPFRMRFVAIVRMLWFSVVLGEGCILERDVRASSGVVTWFIFPAWRSFRADSRRAIS